MSPASGCRFCSSPASGMEGACDVCRPYAKINDHMTHLWLDVERRWHAEGRRSRAVSERPPNHAKYGVRLPLDITLITPAVVAECATSFAALVEAEHARYAPGTAILVRQAPRVVPVVSWSQEAHSIYGYEAPEHNYARCRFGFDGTPRPDVKATPPAPGCVASEWPEGETLPERAK